MSDPVTQADTAAAGEPRVLVLTRAGCHLCEAAVAVVAGVCAATGDSWAERDIDGDAELVRRYTDEVPVTFVDGQPHDFWRVDADRLRTALATSTARRR
jgi:hypothetical protein